MGHHLGLIDDARWNVFSRKRDIVSRETERLRSTWVTPRNLSVTEAQQVLGKALAHEHSLADLLRRPGINFDQVARIASIARPDTPDVSREALAAELGASLAGAVIEQLEVAIKYAGYIDKQLEEVQRAEHFESLALPPELDYAQVAALSHEVRQKLSRHRPQTLGQAARIGGVTPAAISLLLVHLRKGRFKGFAANGSPASDAAA